MTGLFSTHVLSLDALLTVLESVEDHCHTRIMAAKNSKCVIECENLVIITYKNSYVLNLCYLRRTDIGLNRKPSLCLQCFMMLSC